jgi:hypothetical protein
VRFFDAAFDRISLALFDLGRQQRLEITGMCLPFTDRLFRQTRIPVQPPPAFAGICTAV